MIQIAAVFDGSVNARKFLMNPERAERLYSRNVIMK